MEIINRALSFQVNDNSITGDIRRAVFNWSKGANLDDVRCENISIVINELTTNILKHAQRGVVICTEDVESINILALDNGPGILHPRTFEDGFSTAGTAGNGLGAIKRLSDQCDYYSIPNKGTAVLAVFKKKDELANLCFKGFSLPMKGEEVSGDQWTSLGDKVLVADGLGHGLLANKASREAIEAFESSHSHPLQDVTTVHNRLKSTRGAAIAIAYINREKNLLEYAALGNISGSITDRGVTKNLITYNGTAGVQLRKVMCLPYPWSSSATLIMHSDGLSNSWELKNYPGLNIKHPLIIAGILYRDHCRHTDDATVVVCKELE